MRAAPQDCKDRLHVLVVNADHDSSIALAPEPACRGESRRAEPCRQQTIGNSLGRLIRHDRQYQLHITRTPSGVIIESPGAGVNPDVS